MGSLNPNHNFTNKNDWVELALFLFISFCLILPAAHPPVRHMDSQSLISQQPLIGSYSTFKLKAMGPTQNIKLLWLKTTYYGRQPQNIKSWISQLPLVGSSSYFKLKTNEPTKI